MPDFDLEPIQYLYELRTPAATTFFQLCTWLGEIEGYVLVVSLVYVTYDKALAFRLSILALVAMSLNHLLKTLIANPRPFVGEGTHAEKWAVSASKARELATEYSTPSGHAMAGSCFYTHLHASTTRRVVRVAALAALILTGLSRPYLGVHYTEDVLLGWAIGVPMALLATRFADAIGQAWNARPILHRLALVIGSSLVLWLVTRALDPSPAHGPPLAFVSYTGFLAGIVVAYPLEIRFVGFDPKSSSAGLKILRLAGSVPLVLGTLVVLDVVFGLVASDASPAGQLLRYLRYAAAGVVGMLLCPYLFVRLRIAETT